LTNCFDAHFRKVQNANFSSRNSGINIDEAEKVKLGFKSIKEGCELEAQPRNSSLNKYHFKKVGQLILAESANDNFVIDEADHIEAPSAVFSNFKIGKINKTLYFNISSGDLTIGEIGKGFESININNQVSTIIIGIEKDCAYKLSAYQNEESEYFFPKTAQKVDSGENVQIVFLKGDKTTAGNISIRCRQCKVVFND